MLKRFRSVSVVAAGVLIAHPSAAGLPRIDGFEASVYAEFPDDNPDFAGPTGLAFDPATGALFVGAETADFTAAPIFRVPPGGGLAEIYGPPIEDPDTVVFDASGTISGVPGAVIVGSGIASKGPPFGRLTVVSPDERSATLCEDGLLNPGALRADSAGVLVIVDDAGPDAGSNDGAGLAGSPCPAPLFFVEPRLGPLALDAADNIYTGAQDGVVRKHARDGTLLDGAVGAGLGPFPPVAVGPGGAWGDAVYAVDRAAGILYRLEPGGPPIVIGDGFDGFPVRMIFGPDGALYLSNLADRNILRLAPLPPSPPDCPADLDGGGTVDSGDLNIVLAGFGQAGAGLPGDVDADGDVDSADLNSVLADFGQACPLGCGAPAAGACCAANGTPYCDDSTCCAIVCEADPFCCDSAWDEVCADAAAFACTGCDGCCQALNSPGCPDDDCEDIVCMLNPFCCIFDWGDFCAQLAIANCVECGGTPPGACCLDDFDCEFTTAEECALLGGEIQPGETCGFACDPVCGDPGAGPCCESNPTPSCDDASCCELVCAIQSTCCLSAWDIGCANLASEVCGVCGGCCEPNAGPGCADAACADVVCRADFFCCLVEWDQACADLAGQLCAVCGAEKPGACCLGPNSCQLVTPADCSDLGGAFQGAGVVCSTGVCDPPCGDPAAGPCCRPNGTPNCDDQACCDSVCAIDFFCCFLSWDEACAGMAQTMCAGCIGACCLPDFTCTEAAEVGCLAQGGVFFGPGAGCTDIDCTLLGGACCLPDGACVYVTPDECDALAGDFVDDGLPCAPDVCPNDFCGAVEAGACCAPNGTPYCDDEACCASVCAQDAFCCAEIWDDSCVAQAEVLCASCSGACCQPDGQCDVQNAADCAALDGAFFAEVDCMFVLCFQLLGACCLPDGSCTFVMADDCTAAGGEFEGAGVLCSGVMCPSPPPGCGLPDAGSCCSGFSGAPGCNDLECCTLVCEIDPFCCENTWDGSCAFAAFDLCDVCGEATGACCLPGGECFVLTADNCAGFGGVYQGDWTSCGAVACPQPGGACCFFGGDCEDAASEEACAAMNGAYQGDGSACDDVVCPPPVFDGACCLPGGGCEQVTEEECDGLGGSFNAFTICLLACPEPSPCGGFLAGDCCAANGTPNCSNPSCCEAVCAVDAFCCEFEWDQICADLAAQICPFCAVPGDGFCGVGENCCFEPACPGTCVIGICFE